MLSNFGEYKRSYDICLKLCNLDVVMSLVSFNLILILLVIIALAENNLYRVFKVTWSYRYDVISVLQVILKGTWCLITILLSKSGFGDPCWKEIISFYQRHVILQYDIINSFQVSFYLFWVFSWLCNPNLVIIVLD